MKVLIMSDITSMIKHGGREQITIGRKNKPIIIK